MWLTMYLLNKPTLLRVFFREGAVEEYIYINHNHYINFAIRGQEARFNAHLNAILKKRA